MFSMQRKAVRTAERRNGERGEPIFAGEDVLLNMRIKARAIALVAKWITEMEFYKEAYAIITATMLTFNDVLSFDKYTT